MGSFNGPDRRGPATTVGILWPVHGRGIVRHLLIIHEPHRLLVTGSNTHIIYMNIKTPHQSQIDHYGPCALTVVYSSTQNIINRPVILMQSYNTIKLPTVNIIAHKYITSQLQQ